MSQKQAIYTRSGVIDTIAAVQTFSSGFQKRDLILADPDADPKYPNLVKFTFKKEHCALLDAYRKGDYVTVTFNIDGRKWDGPKGTQYFVDLAAFRLQKATLTDAASDGNADVPPPATPTSAPTTPADSADDDLPF